MDVLILAKLASGLVLLIVGAELLVRGAARLALGLGLSPLVVGLTVVAYGTSAPEMAVSVGSALEGRGDLAIGNVVGSNIFNVLFILGLSATLAPLVVGWPLVRLDVPILIAASLALAALAFDGALERTDGALLVAGGVAYTLLCVARARREPAPEELPGSPPGPRGLRGGVAVTASVAAGLALLVAGAGLLVDGAVGVARALGVSELVIGLTVVAAGTSLPEVATSVLATLRGQREIAVGNVVGSNIFNIVGVLGVAVLATPGGVSVPAAVRSFDLPVMVAVAVACLPIFFTGYRVARWEGLLFLGYFGAYTAWVLLAASEHDALDTFGTIVLGFVAPLTAVTLAVLALRTLRERRGPPTPDDG
ncbi:MAG: calcium/sodium antiporter [Myxococcota bacterium]|nr:calcium/sodium antiporter [Myxococcota bacterium]